jgi:hypothetical protein
MENKELGELYKSFTGVEADDQQISKAVDYVDMNYAVPSDERIVLVIAMIHKLIKNNDAIASLFSKSLASVRSDINYKSRYKKKYVNLSSTSVTEQSGNQLRWDFNNSLLDNVSNITAVKIYNFYVKDNTDSITKGPLIILIKELETQSFIWGKKYFHFIGNAITQTVDPFDLQREYLISFTELLENDRYDHVSNPLKTLKDTNIYYFNEPMQKIANTFTLEFYLLDNPLTITNIDTNIDINLEITYIPEN